jgi:hypothetical protein
MNVFSLPSPFPNSLKPLQLSLYVTSLPAWDDKALATEPPKRASLRRFGSRHCKVLTAASRSTFLHVLINKRASAPLALVISARRIHGDEEGISKAPTWNKNTKAHKLPTTTCLFVNETHRSARTLTHSTPSASGFFFFVSLLSSISLLAHSI